MTVAQAILTIALLFVLTLASYIDRLYSEMGKFLSREFQENIDAWEQHVESRLGMDPERAALAAALLAEMSLASLALVFGAAAIESYRRMGTTITAEVAQVLFALVLVVLIFNRFLPQLFFTRTRGLWIRRFILPLRILFYLMWPVTVMLGFLLSVAALAESGAPEEEEHPAEAVEALIEAGKEEGILEESDRALIRSAVEFGDKVVREVMTPRPSIFAVPAEMTLASFTEALRNHAYSRVPVYESNLDHVAGIAFMHDLLHVSDAESATRTVGAIARPAMFTPETKNIQSLLREMQRHKQHMAVVIDEYGSVAGLVTIEDLVEEIVGAIADEHETPDPREIPQSQPDGSYIVAGSLELAQLAQVFGSTVQPLAENYESTTVGGLVTEATGRIPLVGEVVELEGLRFEVLASTANRVERLRVRTIENAAGDG